MKRASIFVAVLLLVISSGCTRHQPFTVEPFNLPIASQADSLVDRLNERYASTVTGCANNTPAFNCSGILIRRATYSPDFDFWTHSSGAVALGSVTFSYLRADAYSDSADITSGFIFMDPDRAKADGKSVPDLRCIYPFMAGTQGAGRPLHGCGFVNAPPTSQDDESTCATLSIPAVTPALWIQNFQAHGSSQTSQCSLSTQVAEQFQTSITVRRSFPTTTRNTSNEVLIETWDTSAPEALPIEALFYNASIPGSLINAQALRYAYRSKTGIVLPIVRLTLGGPVGQRFVVKVPDQEDGWEVVQRLNDRYADISPACDDGKAPLYCNGVIIRALTYGSQFHAWNPKLSNSFVSFSYLRNDISTLAVAGRLTQGIIFRELNYPAAYQVSALCIYMADANTWGRSGGGCGPTTDFPIDSQSCALLGITTLERLKAHFVSVPAQPTWQRLHHQCSLAIEPDPFKLAIDGRRVLITGTEWSPYEYNELVIKPWPQDIPTQLPLDAIFYTVGSGSVEGLRQAREIQKDLWRSAGGLVKPIVGLDVTAGPGRTFIFNREDQAY